MAVITKKKPAKSHSTKHHKNHTDVVTGDFSGTPEHKHNPLLFICVIIALIILLVALSLHIKKLRTSSCASDVTTAIRAIEKNDKAAILASSKRIENKDYISNQNCLYIVAYSKQLTGDYEAANTLYNQLQMLIENGQQLDKRLKVTAENLYKTQAEVQKEFDIQSDSTTQFDTQTDEGKP